jgi:UDP-2,3-diacylglucosamine pyrophosphatase LpxH
MKAEDFRVEFEEFVSSCPVEALDDAGRYVFLSDLHMGDGGPRDDLLRNRELLEAALGTWYLTNGFTLVLNGDIEDLIKFDLPSIRAAWPRVFGLFDAFHQAGRLRKITGNHDLGLLDEKDYEYPLKLGLTLERYGKRIFVCHGHQASRFYVDYDYVSEFFVRYLVKPLRIKNVVVSGNSRRRFITERRIYRAARALGILTVTGHTHRPLFESLSKYDSLRWSVEDLLREYSLGDTARRVRIAELIGVYRRELERMSRKETKRDLSRSIYGESPLLVPCLFNSGCATGKHGFTALEIEGGAIALVHWSSAGKSRPYIEREAIHKDTIEEGAFERYVLKSDNLDQVFARIELLGT